MRRSTWLGRIILATVVPCVIVEGLLQVGALVVSIGARRGIQRMSDGWSHGCAVLCIGDSYTYGVGATKPEAAYPQRLEEQLRSNPLDAGSVVVNAGWPGRNSRDLIQRIAGQFEQYRPRYVAILVGANDMWSRPTHATIPGAGSERGAIAVDDGYHFEWRLPRLAALIFRGKDILNPPGSEPVTGHAADRAGAPTPAPSANGAKTPESQAPLVGAWRCGGNALDLRRDGTATFDGQEVHWTVKGSTVLFRGPAAVIRGDWQLQGDRLRLAIGGETVAREFLRCDGVAASPPPPPPPPHPNAQAWNAIKDGDLHEALEIVENWVAREPDSPWAHHMLVVVGTMLARHDLATQGLEWLRDRREREPRLDTAEAFAAALTSANLSHEAGVVCKKDLERWPDSVSLWTNLAQSADFEGDAATLDRAVNRAIDLDPHKYSYPLASNLRLRLRARLARGDASGALRDALAAFVVDQSEGELRNALRRSGMDHDRALFDRLAGEVGLGGELLAKAAAIATEPPDEEHGTAAAILDDHLRQMIAYCRSHGAEPLLLTYPFRSTVIEDVQRRVAADAHVLLVPVNLRFDELLKSHTRAELYVPDGHCNDLGYGFVAETVASALHSQRHP